MKPAIVLITVTTFCVACSNDDGGSGDNTMTPSDDDDDVEDDMDDDDIGDDDVDDDTGDDDVDDDTGDDDVDDDTGDDDSPDDDVDDDDEPIVDDDDTGDDDTADDDTMADDEPSDDDDTADEMDAGSTSEPVLEEGPGAFDPDFAESDDFFTLMDGPRDGLAASPHGVVQIFYSKNIEPVVAETSFEAPVGTVAIKTQETNGDDEYDVIMVMIKMEPGFDDDTGDWLYQRRLADGSLDAEGAPTLAFCPDCHQAWPDTDMLAGTTLTD